MFKPVSSFSGISVNDQAKAKDFYAKTLGLELTNQEMGLHFDLPGGGELFIYEKPDHQPATFTVLNFLVKDIDEAVAALTTNGVKFEHYDTEYLKTDEKGIARHSQVNPGPSIAWFKDPAENILAVIQAN